jgi:hypothetical protein
VRELAEDWRYGGTLIDDISHRREAFNIILSMPRGTDPMGVLRSAREFAQVELAEHKYVLVLHDHQANPHVHISVRAESKYGKRLDPRKADLHRWRETFAEKLRGWGIDAEASRQASRGVDRNYPSLWRKKAARGGQGAPSSPGAQDRLQRDQKPQGRRRCVGSLFALLSASDSAIGPSLRRCHRRMVRDGASFQTVGIKTAESGPLKARSDIEPTR